MSSPGRVEPNENPDLQRELDQLKFQCEAVLERLRSMYGIEDRRTMRAQELCNDFQRLRWALNGYPNPVMQAISTHGKAHPAKKC